VAADFNFDGKRDLIIGDGKEVGTGIVLLGNGDGTFAADPVSSSTGASPGSSQQPISTGMGKWISPSRTTPLVT
jgi:hypothetical protein